MAGRSTKHALAGALVLIGAVTWAQDAPTAPVAGPAGARVDDFSTFDAKQWALIEGKTKVVEAADATGKKRPVLIVSSSKQVVALRDYQFTDGTIEFEFKGGAWLGLSFHVTEGGNQADIIYFRNPKVAGWERSIRYYCRLATGDGKYTEAKGVGVESGTIPLPPTVKGDDLLKPDGWVKVKCVIAGKQAVIYLNGEEKPAFTIENLHLAGQSGSVGVYAWSGAFRGFRALKATATTSLKASAGPGAA
jgi:hypothetical protein